VNALILVLPKGYHGGFLSGLSNEFRDALTKRRGTAGDQILLRLANLDFNSVRLSGGPFCSISFEMQRSRIVYLA
jgi:hypothetical protein